MSLITPAIQRWIDEGRRDPDALWARAADDLPWFRKWDRVFEWDPPTFRWDPGDITTIEDERSVDDARQAWLDMKSEVQTRKTTPNV